MHYRALSLVLGFAVATTTAAIGQFGTYQTDADPPDTQSVLHSGISGVVTTPDGTPLNNIRIEVHRVGTGAITSTVYSQVNGTFMLENLRQGTYELVAIDGMSEAREQIQLQTQMASVDLRMPTMRKMARPGGIVSVAELRVPEKARHLVEKAESALAKGRNDEADRYAQEALQVAPEYAGALSLRAALKLTRNDTQSAIDDLDKAVKADPSYARAYLLLGTAFNQLGRYDDALRSLDRSTMYDPKSWQCAYEMSKAWMGKHDYAHALQQLNRVEGMGVEKVTGQLHLLKGYAFLGQKQFDQARTELQLYLTTEPNGKFAGAVRTALAQIQTQMAQAPAALTLPHVNGFWGETQH